MTPEDNSHQWAPETRVVTLAWLLTAVFAVVAVLLGDPRGTVLSVVAALLLAALALFGTFARPRLAADSNGLTVRGLTGSRTWRWGEVNVRLVRTRRLGRESSAVEIDADPALVLLGRLDLGAEPEDVVEALVRLRT
ncbi:PH domain-containing protein [Actinokineospora auranticolor]|uniref:PH (Pleckstrin Homology) domain-containing protein n=1 Tax=Actinokineospora auranticolor TaxID=155976 RepID=A0A2S6GSF4_9PSEU|nr:PH domain-containing protein [Actinokineospora auranticolor]PPK68116.1 PH (Pleckstrin Homology) domain-containing protein [Actinokineospora auranticolor]